MKWSVFIPVASASFCIVLLEWPKLKQKPVKDKVAFAAILLAVLLLSMFDLPNTPGPISFLNALFKPFKPLVEQ
ncbi:MULTISPECIES: hypothetical protein [Paenibacillus]|uniref:Uncharacterized protein n=1 Tax=Paenibacillus violae TaxID=3077234 RepID=A0ABU3R979_9BACL|nr:MULTISPECIES: hypothetical protein [Paenibacillus]MDU0200833.1 hypothetical protein [Paenibacillus sp. PFR10]MEC0268331.1 hypothetical protein [Paenibacillus anseongense]